MGGSDLRSARRSMAFGDGTGLLRGFAGVDPGGCGGAVTATVCSRR